MSKSSAADEALASSDFLSHQFLRAVLSRFACNEENAEACSEGGSAAALTATHMYRHSASFCSMLTPGRANHLCRRLYAKGFGVLTSRIKRAYVPNEPNQLLHAHITVKVKKTCGFTNGDS